jgi:hypothetical protein
MMNDDNSYRVCRVHGCRVIYGAVPVSDMVALVDAWSRSALEEDESVADLPMQERWIADGKLAQALGANLVVGTVQDTLAWRARLQIE